MQTANTSIEQLHSVAQDEGKGQKNEGKSNKEFL